MRALSYWYQNRVNTWLDKRIPASDQHTLGMKNIFIFPSPFGLGFLALCVCLFLLGSNYQNNLMLILCYFLLGLLLVSMFACYTNFSGLTFRLGRLQPLFAGETAQLPLWIEGSHKNQGKLHFNFWRHNWHFSMDLEHYSNPVMLEFPVATRGRYSPPRLTVNSYFPFGLFRCWTHIAFTSEFIVYPKPLPCQIQTEFKGQQQQEGVSSSSLSAGFDEFDSLKPYKAGDPLHHVDWKQKAKGRGMISKHFTSTDNQLHWLRLPPVPAEQLEKQLSHLCFQVMELNYRQQLFGLDLGHQKISPALGNEHQHQCLTALALTKGCGDA